MLSVYPDYCEKFRCIADKCRHSCCVGWEIDIDPEAMDRFRSAEGELGERLRNSISSEGEPHFILGKNERCPFLNGSNLCDLIIARGENFICSICADHPRFRSFLPGRTETGIGLCCEAAGKLILGQKDPVRLITQGNEDEEDEYAERLLRFREKLFAIAQDRVLSLPRREEKMLSLCGLEMPDTQMRDLADFLLGLERMDESWTLLLTRLKSGVTKSAEYSEAYEQLLVYFIYRHFLEAYDDGDIESKVLFAVTSCELIRALGAENMEELIEYSRLYSAEIEYSQENMDAIYDYLLK